MDGTLRSSVHDLALFFLTRIPMIVIHYFSSHPRERRLLSLLLLLLLVHFWRSFFARCRDI